MKTSKVRSLPVCQCGSQNFEVVSRVRNHLGRYEFRVACTRCSQEMLVSKSVFALISYLNSQRASKRFLELYDLS